MNSNLLRTKADIFCFLCDQKSLFLYKAQEAEDLGNPDGSAELRVLAEQIGVVTKKIAFEMEDMDLPPADAKKITKKSLTDQIQSAQAKKTDGAFSQSVVSVAHFAEDPKVREAVLESDNIRRLTLDACYMMSGYKDLPASEKKIVYDTVKQEIEENMKKQKTGSFEPER